MFCPLEETHVIIVSVKTNAMAEKSILSQSS
jgi:hypothetical protein